MVWSSSRNRHGPGKLEEMLTSRQEYMQSTTTRERPHMDMREKSRGSDAFFSMANGKDRPNSVYTEFMETDWEIDNEEEDYSEIEDEGIEEEEEEERSSPRISVGSVSESLPLFAGKQQCIGSC